MERITPVRTYLLVGGVLLGLTALTYGVSRINLGVWNTAAALGIAGVKALLIVLVFMHGRYSGNLARLMLLAGAAWVVALVLGTLDDYVTRSWIGIPGR